MASAILLYKGMAQPIRLGAIILRWSHPRVRILIITPNQSRIQRLLGDTVMRFAKSLYRKGQHSAKHPLLFHWMRTPLYKSPSSLWVRNEVRLSLACLVARIAYYVGTHCRRIKIMETCYTKLSGCSPISVPVTLREWRSSQLSYGPHACCMRLAGTHLWLHHCMRAVQGSVRFVYSERWFRFTFHCFAFCMALDPKNT